MKLGSENRNKLYAAVGLAVLALVLIGRMFFSFGSSAAPSKSATVAAPTVPAATSVASAPRGGKKAKVPPARSLDPTLRFDLLKAAESIKYSGNGRNVFMAQAEPPPIPIPVASAMTTGPQQPPSPPPPPPINLKFFGFASKPGEAKRIFLSQGEDVFIASEGDIIDRRYKVVRIMPGSVEIEDVLNNNRQSIPLIQS